MPDSSLSIAQMLQMQQELCEKNKASWAPLSPENARSQLLWMIGEIGEVLDILKKCGEEGIMNDPAVRAHFTEEMCDVLMYISKIMLCYGISAHDITAAYTRKHDRNMGRNYSAEEAAFTAALAE